MRGEGREERGGEMREEGREERGGEGREEEGRGGLSGNVAEEAVCLKSVPGTMSVFIRQRREYHTMKEFAEGLCHQ